MGVVDIGGGRVDYVIRGLTQMTTLVALDRCSEVAQAALRQISLADLMQKRELGHPDRDALKAWHMTACFAPQEVVAMTAAAFLLEIPDDPIRCL